MYFTHGSVSMASRMSFSASSDSRAAVARPGAAPSGMTSRTLENDVHVGEPESPVANGSDLFGDFADMVQRVKESFE